MKQNYIASDLLVAAFAGMLMGQPEINVYGILFGFFLFCVAVVPRPMRDQAVEKLVGVRR